MPPLRVLAVTIKKPNHKSFIEKFSNSKQREIHWVLLIASFTTIHFKIIVLLYF